MRFHIINYFASDDNDNICHTYTKCILNREIKKRFTVFPDRNKLFCPSESASKPSGHQNEARFHNSAPKVPKLLT